MMRKIKTMLVRFFRGFKKQTERTTILAKIFGTN